MLNKLVLLLYLLSFIVRMPNYQHISDEDLLAEVVQDKRVAFNELYERYKGLMLIYTAKRVRGDHAEDIVHDVFLKIWNKRHTLQIDEHFAGYLFKALRSKIIDFMDRSANAKKYLDSLELYSYAVSMNQTDAKLRTESFLDQIYKHLETFGPQYQTILKMRMEGYSNQEIADALGLTEKTVRNHSWSLMKILRAKLAVFILFIIS